MVTIRPTIRPTVRRAATGVALAALLMAPVACTSSIAPGGADAGGPVQTIDPNAPHDPVTINLWTFNRQANEVQAFTDAAARLHQKFPWLTVNFVPNKDDSEFTKSVAAGQTPDVFISGAPDNVAKFCDDGTVNDLKPYLDAAKLDMDATFAKSTMVYTRVGDKQCALPLLTDVYVLYYNKKMFADAGITTPPKTFSELTADAKKLTVRNPDGSVKTFGFVPRSDYDNNAYMYYGVHAGTQFYGPDGKATMSTDPKWQDLLKWDKDLNDFYGPGQVDAFVAKNQSHTDDAENPFVTGQAAMMFEGEWHVGENAEYAPNLDYGVAPMPVADSVANTYGAGNVLGTVAFLPSGSKHQAEAAFVIQQITTDPQFLTTLADAVYNVPTTAEALTSWSSASDPHWKPIIDVYANPGSYYRTLAASGSEDLDIWKTAIEAYEHGTATDLGATLTDIAGKIDVANKRSGG